MKKIVLIALAMLLVSCMAEPQKESGNSPTPPPAPAPTPAPDPVPPRNPIIGYWAGRDEFMLFREDGSFVYTMVYLSGNSNYNGEWSMTDDGKLNAWYRKASSQCMIAINSTLTWVDDNKFRYPDPYYGYHYMDRIM